MTQGTTKGTFIEKTLSVLDNIEYRRIDLLEEFQDIGRVRCDAYTAANLLTLNGKPLIDDVDFDQNAYVFGVYYYGRLASTVRLHHITPENRVSTTFSIFPDELNAWLDAGKTLIDPVRFAADPEVMKEVPGLPFVTLRLAVLASHILKTDYVIQLSTPAHAAFYRRIFKGKQIAEPIIGGNFNIPLGLQATDVAEMYHKLYAQYPFFRSTAVERKALFDRSGGRQASHPVKPTARESGEGDEHGK